MSWSLLIVCVWCTHKRCDLGCADPVRSRSTAHRVSTEGTLPNVNHIRTRRRLNSDNDVAWCDTISDMPTRHGPGLRRRYLAQQLKLLRETAGVEQEHVAGTIRCVRTRVTGFESGRSIPSYTELPVILQLYKAMDRYDELEAVREVANERGWWSIYGLPTLIKNYIGLESDATVIRCYAVELVPGLLQTEAYARDTFHRYHVEGPDVDRGVAARLERQRRVGTEQTLTTVASEGMLHRTLGMGAVGREQISALITASRKPGVEIRIVPFSAGSNPGRSGMFTLLEFPCELARSVGYQEGTMYADMIDDVTVVSDLMSVFEDLRGVSVDLTEVSLIKDHMS